MDMNHNNLLLSGTGSTSSKVDRKTIEKNRRDHMKKLFSKLNSLVPREHQQGSTISSKDTTAASLPNQIDEAIKYIKVLEGNLAILRDKKGQLLGTIDGSASSSDVAAGSSSRIAEATSSAPTSRPPRIEVRTNDNCTLEVTLVTGIEFQLMFYKAIRVLYEEGVDIVNSSFSVLEDRAIVFHTIHAMIEENPRPMPEIVARVIERLNKLTYQYS